MRGMELLRKDWEYQLNEAEILLFSYGTDGYWMIQKEFYRWVRLQNETERDWDWDILCEQLMVYFIFTYFCGAVYDGERCV